MSDSQTLCAALGALAIFLLVGLTGFTVRGLARRLNRSTGLPLLNPEKRALLVIIPLAAFLTFLGFWLTTGPAVIGYA